MVCIYCGGPTSVINSRHQKKTNQVWRRRQCSECGAVFTTREAVDMLRALRVQHGQRYQPFSRDALLLSVYDSLRHRKTAVADATALTETIIGHLYPRVRAATLQRADIVGEATIALKRFDKAAATHYTAFHPE